MSNVAFFENVMRDIRFTARTMSKNFAFTFVVVLTLGLGIGVNTAVFSLINGILLQPLPYSQPGRLLRIGKSALARGNFASLQERLRTIDVATVTLDTGFNLGENGNSVRLEGNGVSSNFFRLLGISPELGRVFQPGDEKPGQSHLVILSHEVWQARFGGDRTIIGRSTTLDDIDYQIIGVMPAAFTFPAASGQLWVPVEINPADVEGTWTFKYNLIGRLRPGTNLTAARAEFRTVFPQILEAIPFPLPAGFGADVDVTLLQQSSVSGIRSTLLALFGAVILILMMACVNVANLLLARSAVRQKEMAIRASLGASRRRIIMQLLIESIFLGLLGGTLGCILASFGLMILKVLLPSDTTRLASVGIDAHVLGFSAVISIVTGMIFGLFPSVQASRPNIEQSLRSSAQGVGTSSKRKNLSAILVAAEIAMAVILVSGAGLLIKSLWVLTNLSTGLNEAHLLIADITPSSDFCKQGGGCGLFYRELMSRVSGLPGVESTAITNAVPLDKFGGIPLTVEDRPGSFTTPYLAWYFQVSPGYLGTMGISLLQGREFAESDNQKAPFVVLVSKSLAKMLWPGENPIGKRVKPVMSPNWGTVVGLVDDVRHFKVSPAPWTDNVKGDFYLSSTQIPPDAMNLVVRTRGNLSVLATELPAAAASVSSRVPVSHVRTMNQVVAMSVSSPRSIMWLFSTFASLALVLGIVGIYSVISYSVSQRTREIGIRMAMGANRSDIVMMILTQGLVLTVSGMVVGLASAVALARVMASLLPGVGPSDPVILAIVSLVVAVGATAASFIPSRRATRVSPTFALKSE
jgi:putative ABC transport system permease protein